MKGVIFDCDGVIVDSEVIYLESLVQYLRSLNIKTNVAAVQYVVGKKTDEISRDLINQFNLVNYSVEEIVIGQRKFFDNYWKKCEIKPMTGLIQFLKKCKQHHLKIALASSSRKVYINDILYKLGIFEYFNYIISGESIKNGKPSPDIFLYTLENMELEKKDVIIIEDSVNGIQAGIASGIFTIGFKGSKIIQDTSKADQEVNSFHEIDLN